MRLVGHLSPSHQAAPVAHAAYYRKPPGLSWHTWEHMSLRQHHRMDRDWERFQRQRRQLDHRRRQLDHQDMLDWNRFLMGEGYRQSI